MLSQFTKDSVKDFLNICKREIKKGNCYFVSNRNLYINGVKYNAIQALIDIGITDVKEIWKHISLLEVNDCIKVDFDYDKRRDMNSEIYVFKKHINNHCVYIKLTLRTSGIVCISFHKDY